MSDYQYTVVDGGGSERPGRGHAAPAMIEAGQVVAWLELMDKDEPERGPHRLLRAPVTEWEQIAP
jgi:hypothetical protein